MCTCLWVDCGCVHLPVGRLRVYALDRGQLIMCVFGYLSVQLAMFGCWTLSPGSTLILTLIGGLCCGLYCVCPMPVTLTITLRYS